MTTVVLCGEREDTGIRRVLVRALSRYGGVQWYDGRRLQASRPAPEFFLYETTHLPKAEQVEGILIFKNLFYLHEKEKAPVGFVPVLDAQNLAAASALRGTQAIGITCGASPRDTLSMASLRDDSAVVSLQRELRDLSGKIWEPHDRAIRLEAGAEMYPIFSENAYSFDTRFYTAEKAREEMREICGRDIWHTIVEVEPIGPKKLLDLLIIAPCTGNTLGKLAYAITDTAVTMAAKAQLRNGRPVLLAISTNDGLSQSAKNIGALMPVQNVFFVPFRQDDPVGKPSSLVADLEKLPLAAQMALNGHKIECMF